MVEGFVFFLAEEIARVRLGQPTITVNAFSAIEKSLRAEVLRYQQGELTVTERAFRASKQFALSEGQKLSQGKPTETGKLITYGYAQFKQIPIDQLAGKIVEFTGECFAFGVLTKGVQITGRAAIRLGKASTQGLEAAEVGLAKFNATYKIRPPVTFQFEAVSNRLNMGIPLDAIKPQIPWVNKKDILSKRARLHPVPLTDYQVEIIEQLAIMRIKVNKQFDTVDFSKLNQQMRILLRKAQNSLRDHMTPDDIAGYLKERQGIQIIGKNGAFHNHMKEIDEATRSLKKALNGPWTGNAEEATILSEQLSSLSKVLDAFESSIERGICKSQMKIYEP